MQLNIKALVKADPDWFLTQFKKVGAFSVLSDAELMDIISELRSYEFKAGTTIVSQGQSANLFFIVHSGSVKISVRRFFSRNKKIAILEAGDFFGESVLVSNSKRIATVMAMTDTVCFVLLKPSFKSLLSDNPLFRQNMRAVFTRRKRQLRST